LALAEIAKKCQSKAAEAARRDTVFAFENAFQEAPSMAGSIFHN
jgi:hypothetical protein